MTSLRVPSLKNKEKWIIETNSKMKVSSNGYPRLKAAKADVEIYLNSMGCTKYKLVRGSGTTSTIAFIKDEPFYFMYKKVPKKQQ